VIAAGIGAAAGHPDLAKRFIEFLASAAAVPVIQKSALEPITPPR
jgi:ABC-type Fe3+ transport system substrate-binding protein